MKQSAPSSLPYVLILGVIIMIAAGFLRYLQTSGARDAQLPLFPEVSDRLVFDDETRLMNQSLSPIVLPQKTFGSAFFRAAIYPSGAEGLPKLSTIILFTKDRARTVELRLLPDTPLTTVAQGYQSSSVQHMMIGKEEASLYTLRENFDCTSGTDTLPKRCYITKTLLFQDGPNTIQISVDGDHLTDGELIEMARSIKK